MIGTSCLVSTSATGWWVRSSAARHASETSFGLHWLSVSEWLHLLDCAGLVANAVYGWFDLLSLWEHNQLKRPMDPVTEMYLGGSPMEIRDTYYQASPINWTTVGRSSCCMACSTTAPPGIALGTACATVFE